MSHPLPAPTLEALVESALALADEQGRADVAIALNQALVALDGVGRLPHEPILLDLGWSRNHLAHLH